MTTIRSEAADIVASRVAAFRRTYRRAVHRLALVRLLWIATALALLLCLFDVLFALPSLLRLLADVLLVAVLVGVIVSCRQRFLASPSLDRRVARLVEKDNPDIRNQLINAVDFSERLTAPASTHTSTALMEKEIDTAAAAVREGVPRSDALRPTVRRELRLALGILAAGCILGLIQPRVTRAVLPRFLAPFADFPPYSPTQLDVEPKGASAEYGDRLDISVRTSGKRPPRVSLVVRSPGTRRTTALPMYESGSNTYEQALQHITQDLVYFARIPGGRSKQYTLKVIKVPRIDAAHVRYDYPSYTRLRSEVTPLLDGVIRAYEGTRVTLTLTSNRPLGGGTIQVGDADVAMQPSGDSPNSASGSFQIHEPTRFSATLTDTEGNRSRKTLDGRVEITPDESPEVTIVSPRMDSFATPTAVVTLECEARDDLGIRNVQLYRSLNRSADYRKDLYSADGQYPFVRLTEGLDLGDLGVRPGDVIEYYASAVDSRPATPQSETSDAFRLIVISEEDYAAYVRTRATAAQLREKYSRLMKQLYELAEQQRQIRDQTRQRLTELQDSGMDEALARRLGQLQTAQATLAERTQQLADRYRNEANAQPVFDIEKDYGKQLEDFAARLGEAQRWMNAGQGSLGSAAGDANGAAGQMGECLSAQDQALRILGGEANAFQQSIDQAGKEIEELFDLYRDVERFKYLLARQESVTRQARFLADRETLDFDDQARLKELAEEERRIREELSRLKDDFLAHADTVEPQYPKVTDDAQVIAGQIESLEIGPLMTAASDAFFVLSAKPGYDSAQKAYEAMLSMVSFCNGTGSGLSKECERRLKIVMRMGLGNTFAQLAQGLSSGMNGGTSGFGTGMDGYGGTAYSPFGLFGDSSLMNSVLDETPGGGDGGGGDSRMRPHGTPLAADVEEFHAAEKSKVPLDLPGGEQIIEEYRRAIIEYFTRMTETTR